MTITVSQITALVGRWTNTIVNEQTNMEAPLVGQNIIPRIKKKDKIGVVNIKGGELNSAGFIADGGTLFTGSDVQPVQGTYSPIALFGRISIPRVAAELASSLEDGIELVKEEMESCGSTLGRQLARGLVGSNIGAPTATVNVASTTFTVSSPAAWRVGMAFEVWNGAVAVEGTTEATPLRVTAVSMPANGEGDTTITFTGSNAGGNAVQWTTAFNFYLRGSRTNTIVALQDITANASLYGQAQTANDWSGNLDATTTTLAVGPLRALMTTVIRRSGMRPSHMLSNRKNEERYSNQLINNRRFANGKMDAVGGATFEFEGVPWVTDENFDDNEVYFYQKKHVQLHEFKDFAPQVDGGGKKGMNMGASIVSSTQLIYDVQVLGIFNLRCIRRNGTGRMSALNS